MRQQQFEAVEPVGVKDAEHGIRARLRRAGFEKQPRAGEILAFERVIERLAVVGTGASGEQQSGHFSVVVQTCRAVQRTEWRAAGFAPGGIGIGAGGQQNARALAEWLAKSRQAYQAGVRHRNQRRHVADRAARTAPAVGARGDPADVGGDRTLNHCMIANRARDHGSSPTRSGRASRMCIASAGCGRSPKWL